MTKSRSDGGTLVLWQRELDPFVSFYPVNTASFTPLVLKLPESPISVQISLYLPTHGKDLEFVSELASLRLCMEEINDLYPGTVFFLRGDSNVNSKNKFRVSLFNQLIEDFNLKSVQISHKT